MKTAGSYCSHSDYVGFAMPFSALLSLIVFTLCCCGGGGSQNAGTVSNSPPDFSLAVSPTSLSIATGSSATVSIMAVSAGGFSSPITVQLSGLPSVVTVSPANISLSPGTSTPITFSVSSAGAAVNATITFTGTSGSLSHTAQFALSVTVPLSRLPPSRTRYVRTDAVTEYLAWLNQHWAIYNPPSARFFVTDPESNQVFVLDAISESKIGSIGVPGAFGIDDTPDHKTLYVGTLIGDVYSIDPVSLTVTHRYVASQIGPFGYQASSVQVLADGRLALLAAARGIPSVDGSPSVSVWNPNDNSISVYAPQYGATQLSGSGMPFNVVCGALMGNIGGFARTADRTKIIIGSIDSDGTLCEVDPSTGQSNFVQAAAFSTTHITASPDGNYIILPNPPNEIAVYDAHSLTLVSVFNVSEAASLASAYVVSADSTTLFLLTDSIIYAYSLVTHQQVGWSPNIYVPPSLVGSAMAVGPIDSPALQAIDGTGLFVGPVEEGVGFFDSSLMRTGPVGTAFSNAYLNPASGPVSGGTQTTWATSGTITSQSPIYFADQLAISPTQSSGHITVTTPAGLPGPVDVYAFATDGGIQIIPEGFSFGPTILEVTPNASPSQGGGVGMIYGYGLGPTNATTIPSDLQVTVGGTGTTILGFYPNAYNLLFPPFQLEAVSYQIPPGTGATDVTVTNSTGSATAHSALSFLPAVQQYSTIRSSLVQGVYDPFLDLYYFTDANKLQVFSKSQGAWLSPIVIPAPNGASQRLWGIALSPNGNNLAIADVAANVIYLLNPANPSSIKTFPIAPSVPPGVVDHPIGVAVSDTGFVYVTVYVEGGVGLSSFFKLDTNTGNLTDYHIDGPQLSDPATGFPLDVYLRNAISADNTRVFFNDDGYVFNIDTATDKVFSASVGPGCCYGDYDLTLSSNQTGLEATEYLYDSDLNGRSTYASNDREQLNTTYVYGAKLSPDGSLLFQPSVNGIDVMDGRLGNLRTRVSLPFGLSLSPNYDALVTDGKDNILIAITGATGNGIAVIDLTAIPEPPPLPYVRRIFFQKQTDLLDIKKRYLSHPKTHFKISYHINSLLSRR